MQFAHWAAHRDDVNYDASVARRPSLAAGHARPGQAGQRLVARQPHPADLRRQRLRQLRRPAPARRRALYTDLRLADASATRVRRIRPDPGDPRPLSQPARSSPRFDVDETPAPIARCSSTSPDRPHVREIRRRPDQGARRPPVSIRVRLRAVRVLPQRQGHRVSRARRRRRLRGRVLDAGCGGGGMPLSLAEHAAEVVGIDPIDRFGQAGVTLGPRTRPARICTSRAPTAWRCRSRPASFDLVLSHAVIEHVPTRRCICASAGAC